MEIFLEVVEDSNKT